MSLLSATSVPTSAARAARGYFNSNRTALATTQPDIGCASADVAEFVYGRDGALTALEDDQSWHGGCSIPMKAAESMLRNMKPNGPVAMLLAPFHAAAIRGTLSKLDRGQAVIAVYANERELNVALHCEDFSSDIASHRLWFVAGEKWDEQLGALFVHRIGLPTPSYFIRLPATEREANAMIPVAERVVAAETSRRDAMLTELRGRKAASTEIRRVCVVAPGDFRLWGDAGHVLSTTLSDSTAAEFVAFNADDPASSSPVALAAAVAECDAVVTANIARSDLPNVLSDDVPWVTWITSARIPVPVAGSRRDGIVLADESWKALALSAGWDESRIAVGGWPRQTMAMGRAVATIIADTRVVEAEPGAMEYSSHGLLWTATVEELRADPFAVGDDVTKYLARRMERFAIREDGFDRAKFIDELLVPAYQQGVARALVGRGISVELFGAGWGGIDGLKQFARGTLQTREDFDATIASAGVLVHCFPATFAHPIDAAPRPVVRAAGKKRDAFVRDVQSALAGNAAPRIATREFTVETVLDLLRR